MAAAAPVEAETDVATTPGFRPAAAQAAGLVMPAFISAAVIFCCWPASVICAEALAREAYDAGAGSLVTVEFADRPKTFGKRTERAFCSAVRLTTGTALTVRPGFCANVPRTKSAFFGLMQYSSILIFLSVETLWRARKLEMFGGISRLLEKSDVLNSSWKSRWISISAPCGSTSARPLLSSIKKGRCMLSSATFTHALFLPRCCNCHATEWK